MVLSSYLTTADDLPNNSIRVKGDSDFSLFVLRGNERPTAVFHAKSQLLMKHRHKKSPFLRKWAKFEWAIQDSNL